MTTIVPAGLVALIWEDGPRSPTASSTGGAEGSLPFRNVLNDLRMKEKHVDLELGQVTRNVAIRGSERVRRTSSMVLLP